MLIYFALIVWAFLGGKLLHTQTDRHGKLLFTVVSAFLLVFTAGLRAKTVGCDTAQFVENCFGYAQKNGWGTLFQTGYEPGFMAFCKVLTAISPNPQILTFASSLLIYPIFCMFIHRNSTDVGKSLFFFLTLDGFATFLNVMRQAMAIAVLLFGVEIFLKRKKRLGFLGTVLIAFTLHKSALLGILFLGFRFVKCNVFTLLALAVSGIALAFGGNIVFRLVAKIFPAYGGYVGQEAFWHIGAGITFAVYASFVVLALTFSERRLRPLGKNPLFRMDAAEEALSKEYVLLCAACGVALSFAGVRYTMFLRLVYYFLPFIYLSAEYALNRAYQKVPVLAPWIELFAYAGAFTYFTFLHLVRPEWYAIVPYSFFF